MKKILYSIFFVFGIFYLFNINVNAAPLSFNEELHSSFSQTINTDYGSNPVFSYSDQLVLTGLYLNFTSSFNQQPVYIFIYADDISVSMSGDNLYFSGSNYILYVLSPTGEIIDFQSDPLSYGNIAPILSTTSSFSDSFYICFSNDDLLVPDKFYYSANENYSSNLTYDYFTSNVSERVEVNTSENASIFKKIFVFLITLPKQISDAFSNLFTFLFIPRENFFQSEFNNFFSLLSDQLGILGTPFEIIKDTFNTFTNLSSSDFDGVITLPELKEPIYNKVLFESTTFDLNSFINSNSTFKSIHNYYILFINSFVVVSLVNLSYKKFLEIFGGVNR